MVTSSFSAVQSENEYEDLLGLWSDLEAGLGIILASPGSIQEFDKRVLQYDRWMQALLKHDADVGLYLLFQLATNSSVGYSASHALVCAVLCHLIAVELQISPDERNSLVHAALTMNIAMTAVQDELAGQTDKPSPKQMEVIQSHAFKGGLMLANLKVVDELWLDIISIHHDEKTDKGSLRLIPPADRLARILRTIDRYAAMISPRKSRSGRSTADSVRSIISGTADKSEDVGHSLIRVVGLYPPGSFVRMDTGEVAVVMRRSTNANLPHVAVVMDIRGNPQRQPHLLITSANDTKIEAALAASAVHLRLNHHLILQLGADTALHA
jgi:HD-GYP domain-containing protein (c-di-GMP phosphodiesterase class II)